MPENQLAQSDAPALVAFGPHIPRRPRRLNNDENLEPAWADYKAYLAEKFPQLRDVVVINLNNDRQQG